ncbi:unnamed protein product [Penicillium salamii]|uniref:PPM-type phosphatase domain-containing protein n=1 Tax=Penicillium salamii TaxID=1612424 RepID=A0A9W4JVT5_9EURO|nr:unnamed protein product [Penicillium salamii]
MKSAFIQLDDEIISDALAAIYEPIPHAEAVCRIAPASAGSCALLTLYEPGTSTLHVAARISAERPDEDHLFSAAGRLLGSEVTRSFGDHQRKWPGEALEDWRYGFWGKIYNPNVPSAPYMTAAPDVPKIQVQPGDFLILATDGFWNHMSNEDAVYCAKLWIEAQNTVDENSLAQVEHFEQLLEHLEPPAENIRLPVENTERADTIPSFSEKEPERQMYPYTWVMEREDFVVEQDNLATHLVRNAFGGKEHDLFCSVMSTLSSDSKQARDDVTVIVVMF